jgi:hypothetical protein
MLLATSSIARVSLVGVCAWLAACASAAPPPRHAEAPKPVASAPATVAPEPAAPAAVPAEPTPAAPVESAGFAETLAALRPAAVQPALATLAAAPADAGAYAQAAIAYAGTDAPVMTLIWGMTHQAMGGGKAEADVAKAFVKVLSERVTVGKDNEGRVEYRVRLAPGEMPLRQQPNGAVEAPLAHAFEGLFGTTLMNFHPPWSIEEFYDVLSSWAGLVSTRGTPLDATLELDAWLVSLAKAGHLEAFCYRLLGSAFPAELKPYRSSHAKELKAFDDYLKSSSFKPSRAVMPDDLVRLK